VIYSDPLSSKLVLKLARDYDPEAIPEFTASEISSCELSRPSWDDMRNAIRVGYIDRSQNFTERVAQLQDSAAWAARGGERAEEQVDMKGLSTAANAAKAAARVLKTLSYPLAQVKLTVNRQGWQLRPGDVFKLTWAPLAISDMACRVTRVSTGPPQDGKIVVDAVEDIFQIDWTGDAPSSGWTDPAGSPIALGDPLLLEAPYAIVGGEDRKVLTLASRSALGITTGYEVWTDPTGGGDFAKTYDTTRLTAAGGLLEDLTALSATIRIADGPDVEFLASTTAAGFAAGANLVVIEDEWIAWTTIRDLGDGSYELAGLARGVMDSTPKPHEAGARAYFVSSGYGFTDDDPYADDITLAALLLPYNETSTMPAAGATGLDLATNSRALRPYAPTGFTVNDEPYPENVFGDLVIAWLHRDRTDTWTYDNSGATSGAETGTHYRVKIYGDAGMLKHTEDGLTGTTWTYTETAERADNGGDLNAELRIVVETIQDAGDELVSWQAVDHSCVRGGGVGWGDNYGGGWS
jgi:hypothetical protein